MRQNKMLIYTFPFKVQEKYKLFTDRNKKIHYVKANVSSMYSKLQSYTFIYMEYFSNNPSFISPRQPIKKALRTKVLWSVEDYSILNSVKTNHMKYPIRDSRNSQIEFPFFFQL